MLRLKANSPLARRLKISGARRGALTAPKSKYKAKRCEVDGIKFMSKGERGRYLTLKRRLDAGLITDLKLQPAYAIEINGQKICKVVLDFSYFDIERKRFVYEDYKGFDTPISKLKRKLVEAAHHITVTVISKR
jgi:hypothetical protein